MSGLSRSTAFTRDRYVSLSDEKFNDACAISEVVRVEITSYSVGCRSFVLVIPMGGGKCAMGKRGECVWVNEWYGGDISGRGGVQWCWMRMEFKLEHQRRPVEGLAVGDVRWREG